MQRMQQLIIRLLKVKYAGDFIGNELNFELELGAEKHHLTIMLEPGEDRQVQHFLIKRQVKKQQVTLPIKVRLNGLSPIVDGNGKDCSEFTIDGEGFPYQLHTTWLDFTEHWGARARITLVFEAELLEHDTRYVSKVNQAGWMMARDETEGGLISLPYALQVHLEDQDEERIYFQVEEGPYAGVFASIPLPLEGVRAFTERNLQRQAVRLSYSLKNEVLEIEENQRKYWAVTDPSDPLPRGVYNLEIPGEPFTSCGDWLNHSPHATTRFPLQGFRERFLNLGCPVNGQLSLVQQGQNKVRWSELYWLLIASRNGKGGIGSLSVSD